MSAGVLTRTCTDCKQTRPIAEYLPIKACKQGWYGRCRECRNRRARERYHPSPEIRAAEIARSLRNEQLRRLARPAPEPRVYLSGLRQARCAAGLSQMALAEHAGLSPTTVGYLERCRYTATVSTINALATALGVAAGDLHD